MNTLATQTSELLTDEELVTAIKKGQISLFNALFKENRKKIYRYIYSLTGDHYFTDDVVQEALLKAYKNFDQFRNDSSFSTWLYAIARNTWKNYLRTLSRNRIDDLSDVIDTCVSDDKSVEDQLNRIQEETLVRNSINMLPSRQRQAMTLRIENDLSIREIANKMKCSVNTVKATCHHGVKSLEQRLI